MRRESLRAEWREQLSAAGVERPIAFLDGPPAGAACAGSWQRLSKPGLGRRERWRWTIEDPHGRTQTFYLKRYQAPTLRQQWDRVMRQAGLHSAAWWEFRQAERMAEWSVPAAPPVGYAEEMTGLLESRSAVILAAVPGEAFDRYWPQACRNDHASTHGLARHDTTRRLARFVAAFHQTGFRHRDLYLCHIFIQRDSPDGPPQFRLIDLARTFRPRWRRMRWMIKDLSQLDSSARQIGASRCDRLRFLLTYFGLQRITPRVRRICSRTTTKGDRILGRIARKGG